MRLAVFFFLHILAIVQAIYTQSKVILANDENFNQIITQPGKFTFVDFYADWCRHCKKVHPMIDQLSELFADHPEVQIVKINGDKDGKKMSKKYVEVGYPTLLFFNNDSGEKVEFNGARDVTAFSNFIQQLSGIRLEQQKNEEGEEEEEAKSKKEIVQDVVRLTPESFDEQIQSKPFAIVSIGATWCSFCEDFKGLFKSLATTAFARENNKILFGQFVVDDFENGDIVPQRYNVQSYPTLIFFKNKDLENPVVYNGSKKSLEKLVDAINLFTGSARDLSGGLKSGAGVINDISDKFKKEMNPIELLQELEMLEDNESIVFYKSILESLIIDQSYIDLEKTRIEQILKNDANQLDGVTIDSLTKRQNILKSLKLYLHRRQ